MIARVEVQQNQLNVAANAMKITDGAKERPSIQKPTESPSTTFENDAGKKGMSMAELEAAVKEIAQDLDVMQTKIAVRFDKESNTGVMEVIDRKTGKVIKQVPPEEILKIKKAFHNLVTGFLLDEKA